MAIYIMKVINIFSRMLLSLSLTIIIELLLALLIGIRKKSDILNIIIVNCITNPVLNYIMMVIVCLCSTSTIIYLFLFFFEIIVMYVEYNFYRNKLKFREINLLLLSIILNFSSVVLGFIITNIL